MLFQDYSLVVKIHYSNSNSSLRLQLTTQHQIRDKIAHNSAKKFFQRIPPPPIPIIQWSRVQSTYSTKFPRAVFSNSKNRTSIMWVPDSQNTTSKYNIFYYYTCIHTYTHVVVPCHSMLFNANAGILRQTMLRQSGYLFLAKAGRRVARQL